MFGKDFTKAARWFARSRGRVQRHPDYLCTAAAVVDEAGHDVFFLDAQARNLPTEALLAELKAFSPDLIVYLASTPSIGSDIAAAALCKEATGAVNVLVGSHVSAEPDDTLNRSDGAVDAVALGEYDYTLRDLASGTPLAECEGIAWLRDGEVAHNARRPYIADLDELPDPARYFHFQHVSSSRGCPWNCNFCGSPRFMSILPRMPCAAA